MKKFDIYKEVLIVHSNILFSVINDKYTSQKDVWFDFGSW